MDSDSGAVTGEGAAVVVTKQSNGYGRYWWLATCSCGWQSKRFSGQWAARDRNRHLAQEHPEPLATPPEAD